MKEESGKWIEKGNGSEQKKKAEVNKKQNGSEWKKAEVNKKTKRK